MSREVTIQDKTGQESAEFTLGRVVYGLLVAGGVAAHLVVAVMAGNSLYTPWSGGGDTIAYVTLAQNLLAGDGYTYGHQATAFRAPLYPFLLAGLMRASPDHWVMILHAIQFLASLLTAWLCARLAARWFGASAGRISLVVALALPTLLYFTGEVLTECTASLLTILYLLYLDEATRSDKAFNLVLLGLLAGVAALERFNSAALSLFAMAVVFAWMPVLAGEIRISVPPSALLDPRRWRRLLLVAISSGVIVSPWLLHTATAFHGRALYSTHAGFAAVEGVIMPLGRTQTGESDAVVQALGWGNWHIETNRPVRSKFGAEPDLNGQAWTVAFALWRNHYRNFVPVTVEKLGAFWLSTDQVFYTHSLSWKNRAVRWVGVAAYWVVLLFAVAGWFRLHKLQPEMAGVLLLFAIVLTALHMPMTMNTRLRSPLFDPLLASLTGGGWLFLTVHFRGNSIVVDT